MRARLAVFCSLALAAASPAAAAVLVVEAVRPDDGAVVGAVEFGTPGAGETFPVAAAAVRAAVRSDGAAWRLIVRTENEAGRGLRDAADSAAAVDLRWRRHGADGAAWTLLRDPSEAEWPEVLASGAATLGEGAGDTDVLVRLGADVGGAPAGAYAGTIVVDLLLLGAEEETGPAWGRILAPHDGARVALGAGRRLSVVARAETAVDSALIERRPETGTVWTPIGDDARGPIFAAVWNLTGTAAGTYVIRARGWRGGLSAGASPTVRVALVPPGGPCEIDETEGGTRRSIRPGDSATVVLPDGSMMDAPAGACPAALAWRAESRPAGAAEAASAARDGLATVTAVRAFDVEGSCAVFETDVLVVLPFGETWPGGVPASALGLFWFDEAISRWTPIPGAEADEAAREIRARVRHFTAFAVFAETFASGLEAMRVYPNPYVPNDGLDENGRPWTPLDPSSGIVFDRLPSTTTIEIYDITGRRVSTLTSGVSGGTSTRVTWDVRNDAGRDVSSGVYVAVVRGGGATVVRKIMVIR